MRRRKSDSPQKAALREMMASFMKDNIINVKDGNDVNAIMKEYQNTVTQDMEAKILFMYAKGMSTADIESHLRELYDIDISDTTVSRITDKIIPLVKEWQ